MSPQPPIPPSRPRSAIARYAPLAVLAIIALAAWRTGLLHELSPEALGRRQDALRAQAAEAPALALGAYVLVYAVLTGACLPVALMLSLLGGLVFGAWIGSGAVLIGATSGALLTYAATRSAFAPALAGRAEQDPRLSRIMQGFGRNAFTYILTLRLLPFFPFALVNVASGLAKVPFSAYAFATLAGGVPTAVIYASLGAGLGESLASHDGLAHALHAPRVIWPLVALTVVSTAPILVQRLRRRGG